MTRKRSKIALEKLAQESPAMLESMLAELGTKGGSDSKPGHWSRRFAASGKIRPLKSLRMS